MKKLYLIVLIYTNFTICNDFSQESEPQQNHAVNNDQNIMVITSESNDKDDDSLIYGSIKFTNHGLRCFFNHKFNNPKYTQDFLPHNLSDMIQFFEYSKNTNQNKKFVRSIFKIFHQKFKSLEYLSAQEFTKFLDRLPDLIEYVFNVNIAQNQPQIKIKDVLYNEFLNKYETFRQDPHVFFNNLSEKIYRSFDTEEHVQTNDISNSELKSMILRFVEYACSKLVWFVEDQPDIWTQFNQTCNTLCKLREKNIIEDIDDINDLIHSALARFMLVLDIRGSVLPKEFYEKAYNETQQNTQAWLNIEEQDEMMKTKKETLLSALKAAHAKSMAREKYGIIS
jgi:hypothetical protein